MARARISYKIFFAFMVIIVIPVLAISAALGRIAGSVERARRDDRFEYARSFMERQVEERLSFASARARQLSEDHRLQLLASGSSPAPVSELALLCATYGLDGAWLKTAGGTELSWHRDPAVTRERFAETLPEAADGGAWVERSAIRFLYRVSLGGTAELYCASSLGRDEIEILKSVLGAELDIAPRGGTDGHAVVLTTRRDAYGNNLAGTGMPRFQPLLPGQRLGGESPHPSDEDGGRTVRAIALPESLADGYLAVVSLPSAASTETGVGIYLATFAVATLMLAIAASFLLSRQLVHPIRLLLGEVEELSAKLEVGTPFEPIGVSGSDEIAELTVAYNHMGRRLRDAYTTLREQNEELRQLDRIKDDFLANTASEIRTPLNAIVGLAESLEGSPELRNDGRRTVGLIARTGRKLYAMVDDLLDYSRLEHDDVRLDMRDFELRSLVDVVVRFCSGLKRPEVELFNLIEPGVTVTADPSRVEQILYNLVGNAVKYTVRGSVIVRSWEEAGRIHVAVNDTGPGIDPDTLASAMAPMLGAPAAGPDGRAHAMAGPEGRGPSMGIRIARRLAELHGGELGFETDPNSGTTATLSLLRAPEARPEVREAFATAPGDDDADELESVDDATLPAEPRAARYRVLAVDDDPVSLRMLANGLGDRYDVTVAGDGAEALRRMGRDQGMPDLILLGIMLPKVSGFEICSMIRKEHPAVSLPIVMITSKARPEDVAQAFAVGANDYVSKPISLLEIKARVKMHIELAKVNEAYGRFVPRSLLGQLGKESILEARLGDYVAGTMTVLASDIRGFTELSERLGPEGTFLRLNEYYSRVSPAIRAHGGFIDKYMGDALMAVFPRSPADAVEAALSMRREMVRYNEEAAGRGQEPLEAGIGLDTGPLMLGTIGESERMDGGIISEVVGRAFRLEEWTKPFGAKILLSGATLEALGGEPAGLGVRYLGLAGLKDESARLPMYELLERAGDPLAERKAAASARFERAVALFEGGDLNAAYAAFMELGRDCPGDPAWRVFMDRIVAGRGS